MFMRICFFNVTFKLTCMTQMGLQCCRLELLLNRSDTKLHCKIYWGTHQPDHLQHIGYFMKLDEM